MNVKPSEIRAASKAGRVAIKVDKQKQQFMLKKQQQSQMKMDKIRAEIEAIKEKERNISGEGSDKAVNEQPISSTKYVTNQEKGEIIQHLTMEKGRYGVKMHQLNINHEHESHTHKICDDRLIVSITNGAFIGGSSSRRELRKIKSGKILFSSDQGDITDISRSPSHSLTESYNKGPISSSTKNKSYIKEKQSPIKFSPSLINTRGQEILHSKSRSMASVRRGSVIAITKASTPEQSQLGKMEEEKQKREAQREKLEEGRRCFEVGHRLCWRLQDSHSALGEYRKALFVREGILGKYHEDTGKIYYWVGQSLVKLKEYDEAIVAFSRALRIFDRVLARNHKYQKWAAASIAAVFHEMDNHDDYTSYKAALDDSISHEVKGDNFTKNKLFSQAISEYRTAIECILVQDIHPDSADLHSKIAIILRRMGEFDKALKENRFALEIYGLSLGPEHPETVKTLNRTMGKKRFIQSYVCGIT